MKKYYLIVITLFLCVFENTNAQVGIGNTDPDPSSILDITSIDKGILVPRMTSIIRDGIISRAQGLIIYNTTDLEFNYYESGWKSISVGYNIVSATSLIKTYSSLDVVVPGMNFSPKAGNYLAQFNTQYVLNAVGMTTQGVVDLNATINTLTILGTESSSLPQYLTTTPHNLMFTNNEIVTHGIYQITGVGSMDGILNLDAGGNPDALFVFKITGAFNTGAVRVYLNHGASASNVFWISDAAVGLGANTVMKGTMISRGAVIAIGADCDVDGRMFTTLGAIGFRPEIATIPTGSSLIDLGILNAFSMLTTAGAVGNTVASYTTGNIGTKSGTVNSFGDKAPNSTINGYVDGLIYLQELKVRKGLLVYIKRGANTKLS